MIKRSSPVYQMLEINSKDLIILRDEYQRKQNEARIAKIVADFDERIANEPKVSWRDGHYYVFDGQHTIAARKILNDGKDLPILCKVYFNLTELDESLLFAKQTGVSSKPTAGERMRAWLYGEDKEAILFRDVTESTGLVLELGGVRCKNHLVCISTALHEFRHAGKQLYKEALRIIVEAWDGNPESLCMEIIKGVVGFVKLYYKEYNRRRLVSRLHNVDPREIRKSVKRDFVLAGSKRYIDPIYRIYNGSGSILPLRF